MVVYSSQIPLHDETSLGSAALVVQNTIQMVGGFFGIIMVTKFSRFYMITVSTYIAFLFNVLLGIGSILEMPVLSFVVVCLFMFTESLTLTSVAWTYPA